MTSSCYFLGYPQLEPFSMVIPSRIEAARGLAASLDKIIEDITQPATTG
jgi:hypothetical protein